MSDAIMPSAEELQADWLQLARSPRLAVLLDLDGTMIPFAETVAEARLDDAGAHLLRRLHDAGVQLVVVSGRKRAPLDELRPHVPNAWWVAEHGAWRHAGAGWHGPPITVELAELEQRLAALGAPVQGAWVERKSLSVGLHWRQVAARDQPRLVAAAELSIDEWLEAQPDFERLDGAMVLEVRHRSANKGTAVRWCRERLPAATRLVAFGDDLTDEDTFAALGPHDVAVGVGDGARRRGHAAWWVAGHLDTRRVLAWIADARTTAGAAGPVPVQALVRRPEAAPQTRDMMIISNRMPAAPTGRGQEVGGLVSALQPIITRTRGVWLGWSGQEREPGLELTTTDDGAATRAAFDYPPGWRQPFYAGFCNQSLWPLLHCFPGRVRYVDEEWTAYVTANEAYARLAAHLVAPTGTVWVHDYHLMLAGAALRHLGHRGPLGFFLHVPFPPRDVWETLPWSAEVMDAMLAFDLVGFHTPRWAENFLAAARGTGGGATVRGNTVRRGAHATRVDVFPIGIDARPFDPPAEETPAADIEGLRQLLGDRQLLLGVDRLDYSKGIPERLEAFRRMLHLYPHWRGRVSFVQISVPSRADVPEYAELRRRVEELVGRINGELGEADWVPVRYLYRSYEPTVLAQLYRLADVAVVTPLRDGMNLVAKEFVAAQRPGRPGVLVLSKFAGAAEELDAAVLTNPYHADGLAADLDRALRMAPEERRARHARLLAATRRTSATAWAEAFLDRLQSAHAA